MTRFLLRAVIAFSFLAQCTLAQIPGNVMSRVYQIRMPGETATSFILEDGDKQYLFTANHVVESLGGHAKIELMVDGKWVPLMLGFCTVTRSAKMLPC